MPKKAAVSKQSVTLPVTPSHLLLFPAPATAALAASLPPNEPERTWHQTLLLLLLLLPPLTAVHPPRQLEAVLLPPFLAPIFLRIGKLTSLIGGTIGFFPWERERERERAHICPRVLELCFYITMAGFPSLALSLSAGQSNASSITPGVRPDAKLLLPARFLA